MICPLSTVFLTSSDLKAGEDRIPSTLAWNANYSEIIEPGLLIASLYRKYDKSIDHTQSYSDVLTDRQTWREDAGLLTNIKKRAEFMLHNFMFHLRVNPEL